MGITRDANNTASPTMAPIVGVALESFTARDATRVQSMIDLSKRWLRYKWVVCSQDACDMLIKKTTNEDGEGDISLLFKGRLEDFRYREKVEHPLRMQVLLDLFKLIEDFLELEEPSAPVAQKPKKGFLRQKKVENPLFKALEEHFSNGFDASASWVMMRNGEPWFGISPQAQKAYINTLPSGQTPDVGDDDTYEILPHSKVQKIVISDHSMPIPEWWWHLGVFLSRFDIAPSIQGDQYRYLMTLWPDFGRLAHHANHVRVAAHIAIGPCNAKTLADLTGAKPRHVSSLINALWLMQALETEVTEDSEPEPTGSLQSAVPSIFNKIRARFKL